MPSVDQRGAGRYAVDEEIASGGMGTVYRATDLLTGEPVALKRFRAESGERMRALFRREFHTLSQLDHPRIIRAFEYGEDAAGAWYTMELLGGRDLRDAAPLPLAESGRVLADVASALSLLHARRLLHRDLSPRNVRVMEDGRAKLLDFGALAPFGRVNHIVGTPPAIPPEAVARQELDGRTDLYGLGALAYWLLTGRHAYPASSIPKLQELWSSGSPPAPSSLTDGLPPELDDLVLGLLSLEPLARPPSAAHVLHRLQEALDLELATESREAASYLVSPAVSGRDAVLEQLSHVADELRRGRGEALLIVGSAGLGKSRLLSEGAHRARLTGATAVVVDGSLGSGPHGTARTLVTELLEHESETAHDAYAARVGWLGHLLPNHLPDRERVDLPLDRAEQRMRLNEELLGFFRAIAATRPLCIAVDRADVADDASIGILGVLAAEPETPIAVLFAARTADSGPLSVVAKSSRTITLAALDAAGTEALTTALFGEVPNGVRLGAWLHERAGGNTAHTLALATRLVDEGVVRFARGAWSIPDALPRWSTDLQALYEARLEALSPNARAVAESMSLFRGAVPLADCLAVVDLDADAVFDAISELVGAGVVAVVDETYWVHHEVLREHLYQNQDPERRKALHLQIARRILSEDGASSTRLIEAGRHLIRGGEELEGADQLELATRGLTASVEGLGFAAPALEEALEVYDRHDQPDLVTLPLLDSLTAAGWYVDYGYLERHGWRTLETGMRLGGLDLAPRVSSLLGRRLGLQAALVAAATRHRLTRGRLRNDKYAEFADVLRPMIGCVGILIGVAATLYDGREARKVFERAAVLEAFPDGTILRVMYDYARVYKLTAEGNPAEAESIALRVLGWFQSPEGYEALGEQAVAALTGGILTGLSSLSAFRDDADGTYWAAQLEGLGLSFYAAMAVQARHTHHLLRGESAAAERYREDLERRALTGGTLWQSAVLVTLLAAGIAARSGDTVGLRRHLEALEEQGRRMPPVARNAQVYRAALRLLERKPEQALELLDGKMDTLGAGCWGDGLFAEVLLARALIGVGELERARQQVDRLEARIDPRNERYTFGSLDGTLIRAELAVAEGDPARALAVYDTLIARWSPHEVPLTLCRLHEPRAKVAAMLGQEADADRSAQAVAHWARLAENPLWLGRARKLQRQLDIAFDRQISLPPTDEGRTLTWHTGDALTSAQSLFSTPAPEPRHETLGAPTAH